MSDMAGRPVRAFSSSFEIMSGKLMPIAYRVS